MEDKRVRVSAMRVDHDVDVADAYAYRFDILAGANRASPWCSPATGTTTTQIVIPQSTSSSGRSSES